MTNMALMLKNFILVVRTIQLILLQDIEKFLYVYRDYRDLYMYKFNVYPILEALADLKRRGAPLWNTGAYLGHSP